MKRALAILTPFLLAVLAWAANDIVLGTLQPGASGPSWRLQGTDYVAEWGTTVAMPTGLVAHWKMNDDAESTTVEDNVGGYDGVATSNTALLTVTGKIGKALYFANSNRVVTTYTGITGSGARTMCAWFKYNGKWAYECALGYGKPTGTRTIIELRYAKTKKLEAEYGNDRVFGLSVLPSNEWHHLAFTYNGITGIIYLNGVADGTANDTLVTSTNATHPLCIAKSPNGDVPNWPGSVDDVRFYGRALTSNEIAQIYNGGAGTED